MLTAWKKIEYPAFLGDVSSVPLQQALRALQGACANSFDKRTEVPRFGVRKRFRASAEHTKSGLRWRDGQLRPAKIAAPLNIAWSRPPPAGAEPSAITVSRDPAGRRFVSILVVISTEPHAPDNDVVGVDAGITSLLTLPTGEKITNPRRGRREHARLVKAPRVSAHPRKGSASRDRARRKVVGVHAQITDRRKDRLHAMMTRLVRENHVVVMGGLQVRSTVQNSELARAISDASCSEFRSVLECRATWYGREVIAVDRSFPFSKTWSACGKLASSMPLDVRGWTCEGCGTSHDGDVNAAKNILAAGLAVSACGAGARSQRGTSRTGQSTEK